MQNSTELNAQDSAQVSVKSKATGLKRKGKLVYGFGVNDYAGKVSKQPFYNAWMDMLKRCHCEKHKLKKPTYTGCTVCDEWKSLTVFKRWHDKNYVSSWHLDKDLLAPGNKVYKPDFCRYIPQALNKLLTDRRAARGKYPKGVNFNIASGKFESKVKVNGLDKYLGRFPTPELAESAYKKAKSAEILRQVDLHHGLVDQGVLDSLTQIANNLKDK